jgi:hypothetical protein
LLFHQIESDETHGDAHERLIHRFVGSGSCIYNETYTSKQVLDTGKMPWTIVETAITLTLANPGLKSATQLDVNGNARQELRAEVEGRSLRLVLPRESLYVVLGEKKEAVAGLAG